MKPSLLFCTFTKGSTVFKERILRKFFAIEDVIFEKLLGLEFSGNVHAHDLVTTSVEKIHAVEYRPVFTRNLREIFNEVKKTGYVFNNFIDIGSGKGKACFFASENNEFHDIYGVEFSAPLVNIANKNKHIYGAENIHFLNVDASNYMLPNGKNLVFLFNPFDQFILEKFLLNNIEHFQKENSLIAYANDVHRLTLCKLGFTTIFRNQTRRISIFEIPK